MIEGSKLPLPLFHLIALIGGKVNPTTPIDEKAKKGPLPKYTILIDPHLEYNFETCMVKHD